jgi:hypothetical protein
LTVNAKKSAVFAVKRHDKLRGAKIDLKGIPIVTEYCYLGVTVDNCGGLQQHLDRVRQRSSYLRSQMRYYACQLSFENQYLLWAVYVRPYFMYVAPLLETQTQTTRKNFHSAWRQSFKTFLGLPTALPSAVLERILHNSELTCSDAAKRNAQKISRRFGDRAITRKERSIQQQQEEE